MAAVAATFPTSLAAAQQSGQPEWSQFQGGPGHPGTRTDGPAPPYRVRWTRPAPEGRALSGAVIFGGQAMTVGQSAVYAIDLASGDVTWEVPRAGGALSIPAVVAGSGREPDVLLYLEGPETGAGAEVTPSPTGSPSASASPSPSASAPGRGADLVAIDIADQSELWRTPLAAASRTGVTVEGDTAYVADEAGTVYAVGIADGAIRWSRGLEGAGPCVVFDAGRIDSPVAAADGRVVSLARNNDEGSVAVSVYDQATGDCEWRTVSRTGTAAASAPAAGDGNVILGFGDRVVRSLGGDGGVQRWGSMALSLFLPVSAPAFDSDAVYAVDVGGGLYRFDAADGARTWSYQLNETVVRSSPVVVGDAVLVGLNDGRLVAIDAASGHLVWQNAATPGLIGAIAVGGDTIVAVKGGRDAGLIAFENDPQGSLVDVPSPTELELGTTLLRFGLAALLAGAIVLVPGVLARRRFGTAFAAQDVEEMSEEEP